jgi:hypothetical protein
MLKRALLMIPILAMSLRSASDPSGKWRVRFDGDPTYAPKTIGSMILDLKVEGQIVSGTVTIGVWPGLAPIADGKVENGHITFSATGNRDSTTGIPTCVFDVTVDGDTMHASFRVTQNPGGPLAGNREYRYVGTRTSSTNN